MLGRFSYFNFLFQIVLTIERVVPTVEPEKPSELCSIVSNTLEGDMNQIFNAYNEKCAAALLTLSTNEEDANGVSTSNVCYA